MTSQTDPSDQAAGGSQRGAPCTRFRRIGLLSNPVFTYSRRLAPLPARGTAPAGPALLSPPRSRPAGARAAR